MTKKSADELQKIVLITSFLRASELKQSLPGITVYMAMSNRNYSYNVYINPGKTCFWYFWVLQKTSPKAPKKT